jgi:splicing factor 4
MIYDLLGKLNLLTSSYYLPVTCSNSLDLKRKFKEEPDRDDQEASNDEAQLAKERERKRQSRWGPQQPVIKEEKLTQSATSSVSSPSSSSSFYNPSPAQQPTSILARSAVLSRITTADPQILTYAVRVFGTTDLTEEQWKQCMDQVKVILRLPVA